MFFYLGQLYQPFSGLKVRTSLYLGQLFQVVAGSTVPSFIWVNCTNFYMGQLYQTLSGSTVPSFIWVNCTNLSTTTSSASPPPLHQPLNHLYNSLSTTSSPASPPPLYQPPHHLHTILSTTSPPALHQLTTVDPVHTLSMKCSKKKGRQIMCLELAKVAAVRKWSRLCQTRARPASIEGSTFQDAWPNTPWKFNGSWLRIELLLTAVASINFIIKFCGEIVLEFNYTYLQIIWNHKRKINIHIFCYLDSNKIHLFCIYRVK